MATLNHANVAGSVYNKTRRRIGATIMAIQALAGPAESDMKTNAPWRDRTSAARNSLNARAEIRNTPTATSVSLRLAHGVQYGVWLELKNAGRYAIVRPTAAFYRSRVQQAIRRIWGPTPL
jgi:hypothetical protein